MLRHQGRMALSDNAPRGLRVRLYLPLASSGDQPIRNPLVTEVGPFDWQA